MIHVNWTIPPLDEESIDADVIFAVDADDDGPRRAIIADVTTDDAWIAADVQDARTLTQWR